MFNFSMIMVVEAGRRGIAELFFFLFDNKIPVPQEFYCQTGILLMIFLFCLSAIWGSCAFEEERRVWIETNPRCGKPL